MSNGTLPTQRTISSTLAELAERTRTDPPTTPVVLVVGTVVGLREHLRWFDNRPLSGRRVMVTRSREQAPELVAMLEQNGAEAIEAPVLRIAPPADPAPLVRAAASAGSFDWIIFSSTNAVAAFVNARQLFERASAGSPNERLMLDAGSIGTVDEALNACRR